MGGDSLAIKRGGRKIPRPRYGAIRAPVRLFSAKISVLRRLNPQPRLSVHVMGVYRMTLRLEAKEQLALHSESINHGVCERIVISITSLLTLARPLQPE